MKKTSFLAAVLAALFALPLILASCSNAAGGTGSSGEGSNGGGTAETPETGAPAITTEILQSEHAKVYKVPGGLMFKITRPTEDVFNPEKLVKEEPCNDYVYVGEGKGDYRVNLEYVGEGSGDLKFEVRNVGQGNGNRICIGKCHYKDVARGSYGRTYTEVDANNGNCIFKYEYVGPGNGDYSLLQNGKYEYVGYPHGDYCSSPQYVGEGNGDWKFEYVEQQKGGYDYSEELVDEYVYVGDGKGDYREGWYNVGQGNGDFEEVWTNVGQGNGNYEYRDTIKTYGGWTSVFISTSGGFSKAALSATLDLGSPSKDELTVFWPLCEPGKLCEYEIQIEPYDGTLRESILCEKLVVAADEGLGEIIKEPKLDKVTLSYDGQKPSVKMEGLSFEPPVGDMKNFRSSCAFFATNQSQLKADGGVPWDTNYAIPWIGGRELDSVTDEFVWSVECRSWDPRSFDQIFDDTQKDTLHVTCHIRFDIPDISGVSSWNIDIGDATLKIR